MDSFAKSIPLEEKDFDMEFRGLLRLYLKFHLVIKKLFFVSYVNIIF